MLAPIPPSPDSLTVTRWLQSAVSELTLYDVDKSLWVSIIASYLPAVVAQVNTVEEFYAQIRLVYPVREETRGIPRDSIRPRSYEPETSALSSELSKVVYRYKDRAERAVIGGGAKRLIELFQECEVRTFNCDDCEARINRRFTLIAQLSPSPADGKYLTCTTIVGDARRIVDQEFPGWDDMFWRDQKVCLLQLARRSQSHARPRQMDRAPRQDNRVNSREPESSRTGDKGSSAPVLELSSIISSYRDEATRAVGSVERMVELLQGCVLNSFDSEESETLINRRFTWMAQLGLSQQHKEFVVLGGIKGEALRRVEREIPGWSRLELPNFRSKLLAIAKSSKLSFGTSHNEQHRDQGESRSLQETAPRMPSPPRDAAPQDTPRRRLTLQDKLRRRVAQFSEVREWPYYLETILANIQAASDKEDHAKWLREAFEGPVEAYLRSHCPSFEKGDFGQLAKELRLVSWPEPKKSKKAPRSRNRAARAADAKHDSRPRSRPASRPNSRGRDRP